MDPQSAPASRLCGAAPGTVPGAVPDAAPDATLDANPNRLCFSWCARALTDQDSACIIHVSNSMCMQKEEIESDRNRQRLRKQNLPHLRELEQRRGHLRELKGRRPRLLESGSARDKESADSGRARPQVS